MTRAVVGEVERLGSARKKVYTFLSLVFRQETDEELLKFLRKVDWEHLQQIDDERLKEGCEIFRKFLQGPEAKQVIEDLAVDFASIFLGHGRSSAHPYESVYLGKEKVVMEKPRNQVAKIYADEGFQKTAEFNEPEDHVAIELEFMACLCQKVINKLKIGDIKGAIETLEIQENFFKNHLGAWVPCFCSDVIRSAELDYYRAIAQITRGFLAVDSENINSSILSLNKIGNR